MAAAFSTRRVRRTSGFPKWPSSGSREVSPSGHANARAVATRSSSSVAWQYVWASIRRMGRLTMEPLQGCPGLPAEILEAPFVYEAQIGEPDAIPAPPADFPHALTPKGLTSN